MIKVLYCFFYVALAAIHRRVLAHDEKKLLRKLTDTVDPSADDTNPCFSGLVPVEVKDKGMISMSDLQVGDLVLSAGGYYQPVYAFGHRNPTQPAEFLKIQTEGSEVEMTASHLVFLDGGKVDPVRADTIKVGDVLLQGGDNNGKVTKIETVMRDGIYGPWTPDGTIVVDGTVASSYASFQDHSSEFVEFQGGISIHLSLQRFIHMASSPFRLVCLGISSKLCNVYNEEGIPLIVSYGGDFVLWVDKQNILIQMFLFVVVGALAGLCLLVENIFGPSAAPLMLVSVAGVYILMKRNNISFRGGKVKAT